MKSELFREIQEDLETEEDLARLECEELPGNRLVLF